MSKHQKPADLPEQRAQKAAISAARLLATFSSSSALPAKKTDNRIQISVRMTAEEQKALKRIASDLDTTAPKLVKISIRRLLKQFGHKII